MQGVGAAALPGGSAQSGGEARQEERVRRAGGVARQDVVSDDVWRAGGTARQAGGACAVQPAAARGAFESKLFAIHVAVLVAGAAMLVASAFHGAVWFDESYSIAIAWHSFADIWRIGANDVHPVLFYWCLHVLYLAFGLNVLAYRLFTVAGIVALGVLGVTHVRRDFGPRVGVLFSFFVLFAPCSAYLGLQIRMYSWAAFAVAVVFLYAYRIYARADGRAPLGWWFALFGASLAAAYLHYYAVIAAFVVNLLLLVGLLAHRRTRMRDLKRFAIGAALVVCAFVPWLAALLGQVGNVSSGFWISFDFPESLFEILGFPLVSESVWDVLAGAQGEFMSTLGYVLVGLAVVWFVAVLVFALYRMFTGREKGKRADVRELLHAREGKRDRATSVSGAMEEQGNATPVPEATMAERAQEHARECASALPQVRPELAAFAVYVGMILVVLLASAAMQQLILYCRYLFVAEGVFLLAAALALVRLDSRMLTGTACALVLAFSCFSQVVLVADDYDEANAAPVEYYESIVAYAQEENADGEALVVSGDIGIAGVLAVTSPDIPQVYLDVYGTRAAYEAYAPVLDIVDSLDEAVEETSGYFVLLNTESDAAGAYSFAEEHNAEVVEVQTFYRPYNDLCFTIALLYR